MEKWHQSLRHDRFLKDTRDHQNNNQSFSSTLLDAIYRSIDEGGADHDGMVLYRSKDTVTKKQQHNHNRSSGTVRGNNDILAEEETDIASLRRAILIEKWMEKKVIVCRSSATVTPAPADFAKASRRGDRMEFPFIHSSSSSSESSCGGGFSSSEADSINGVSLDVQKSAPKPVRTTVSPSARKERSQKPRKELQQLDRLYDHEKTSSCYASSTFQKAKHEGGRFVNTKSKALKMYAELKKVKQPISPGAKLAGFLNSLFSTAGNAKKKPKVSSSFSSSLGKNADDSSSERTFKSAHASTCSSASSFSRSCLSKTPSTATARVKQSNGVAAVPVEKRSVTFHPAVSVIVDEDSRPCRLKNVYGDHRDRRNQVAVTTTTTTSSRNSTVEDFNFRVRKTNKAGRDLLMKSFQKKDDLVVLSDLHHCDDKESDNDDDGDIDDAVSCSSSDLFELDNLSAIGVDRYHEDLPVYETTHFDRNRAIASGFIL